MDYGLIGHPLAHSFSKEIHESIADYTYEICDISPEKLDEFMKKRRFKAINVTIPYKQAVIPYLDSIDVIASEIGAVNTVVNKNGRLYGYNTDFFGLKDLILRNTDTLLGKTVLILGTGGTAKTAMYTAKKLGALKVFKATRNEHPDEENVIPYSRLNTLSEDVNVIINCTPVGMYPSIYESAVSVFNFPRLTCVIDAVYNPLRTKLVSDAEKIGIRNECGLYMLVSQAVHAIERFIDTKIDASVTEKVYRKTLLDRENIVLTGMPGSGKTTFGKALAEITGRELIDTDEVIKEKFGEPADLIRNNGENYFRDLETRVISEVSKLNSFIIATGGGGILREENVSALKMNGKLFFIDRPLELLIPTEDRPLSSTVEAVSARYNERIGTYISTSDYRIDNSDTVSNAVEKILNLRLNHENMRY